MKQVLVREKQLNGDNRLRRGNVLSQQGDVLRILLEGQKKPIDVKASETIPAESVFGSRKREQATSVIPKAYASSPSALMNLGK